MRGLEPVNPKVVGSDRTEHINKAAWGKLTVLQLMLEMEVFMAVNLVIFHHSVSVHQFFVL